MLIVAIFNLSLFHIYYYKSNKYFQFKRQNDIFCFGYVYFAKFHCLIFTFQLQDNLCTRKLVKIIRTHSEPKNRK